MDNREVDVWVRDINGAKYPVTMPISSRFADVMQKVYEQHRHFQGIFAGFQGGSNERTTVSQMLPVPRPRNYVEADYLYEHPIQPKFKVVEMDYRKCSRTSRSGGCHRELDIIYG
ncbi:uncharacterized protein PITG_09909 [Phytophthora infestans T30-4]|uniref:Uncharacterized protein n=1 Tax=Phytophthora infestans (strain T30-4) TaxID=403677 RepID=D0NDU2_PHYIT|nr:uncharacterized protein PITG_09909 [Phytophthora infestans T30-4]EEY56387.1 conserved hypothetical protein [Phytophthora infestans T30-4]|eukprot:XP_002902461.1 conserved hypothetical protein [Phytophthora infestans T30-4]